MATYISLINYTAEGIKNLKDAPNRLEAARSAAKAVGGELKDVYLTMGGYDIVALSEFPNDEVAATYALTLASQGRIRTTTLRAFTEAEFTNIVGALP